MSDDITLHTRGTLQVTMVSNKFIDSYMADANGEFVKIYLYLLRELSRSGQPFSVARMAEKLGHTQLDIKRALSYWEEQHLLRMEYDSVGQLCGICMLAPEEAASAGVAGAPVAAPAAVAPVVASAPVVSAASVSSVVPAYSPEELMDFQANDEISELFAVTEGFLKHPLSSNEMNTVIFWYDSLRLPMDVIEYLIEYCMETGHASIYYMNKVAISWAEDGITTLEDARARNNIYPQSYYAVLRAFGIKNRNLIDAEKQYVDKWTKQYALPLELINEACRRTIANAGKASFEYADSILTDWFQAGVKSTQDIDALDQKHRLRSQAAANRSVAMPQKKSSFHNFDDLPIDYQEVERMLLRS